MNTFDLQILSTLFSVAGNRKKTRHSMIKLIDVLFCFGKYALVLNLMPATLKKKKLPTVDFNL